MGLRGGRPARGQDLTQRMSWERQALHSGGEHYTLGQGLLRGGPAIFVIVQFCLVLEREGLLPQEGACLALSFSSFRPP